MFRESRPLFPPSVVFSTLSCCPFADCMFSLGFGPGAGSSAGFVEQLSRSLAYLSSSAPSAFLSPLCVPSSHRCQAHCLFVLVWLLSVHFSFHIVGLIHLKEALPRDRHTNSSTISEPSASFISICILLFSFGVKTGKKCV